MVESTKARVLIIGAGSVGAVVTRKCAKNPDVFSDIMLASRTIEKCKVIQKQIGSKKVQVAQVDADNAAEVGALIQRFKPDLVVNVALPYQDLSIMDACIETGVPYLDTANYEPPNVAHFEYKWQWQYQDKFKDAGIMAVLGCGFDPGASNAYCRYIEKHHLDEIHAIDILDCNAGTHHKAFATNFNPEINIREVTQVVRHWENGEWIETPPIMDPGCVHMTYDYPEAGPKESYLLYHEELESLVKNIEHLERIRFWMTFSENYLTHLRVFQDIGLTRIDPVKFQGVDIIPIQFLKALLPDPSSLAANYQGKTVIGCLCTGIKDGEEKTVFIYNVCDHEQTYQEIQANAVSYTAGVPAACGAMLMATKAWTGEGVFNVEQLDPDPFLEIMAEQGLPWTVTDSEKLP
ncbi:MAG TPA: saccharopine dehydrogenase family protein [Candidatus Lokiarchaeia archaeon]|nr:saccharopine dehydrogenase family protein [Candidatus Lokiarchaeia archaeon]